jgi:DNA-binding response OmpR family regulator
MYVSQQQLRKLQILLVESDAQAREKVQQALGNEFTLRFARSLDEARSCLEDSAPDVLLSEVVLAGASGLDLCRLVRQSPSWHHISIMFLTTLSTSQDKIAGFHAGADDYVIKPFDGRHLAARIRLLSRIKQMEHDRD